jgi:N6-adenosine-specific RNA methylase IME4
MVTPSEAWEAYGRLHEGLHIVGYTFERACEHLEWLLVDNRWALGGRFDDVNAFMDSIRLDQFRAVAEQRKRIALRIKELQPEVSNRRIAKTLGVGHDTIDRALGRGANAPGPTESLSETSGADAAAGANAPRAFTGAEAAKVVAKIEQGPALRADRRNAVLARIVEKNPPLPFGRRWPVLYADPAWEDEFGPNDRQAERHYPLMSADELKALPVLDIAADDSILFLWAAPHTFLLMADIMKTWGFTYRTHFVWAKIKIGCGEYLRNQHECLLVGRRGAFPPPFESDRVGSVVEKPPFESDGADSIIIKAPTGAHSEKPAIFAEFIEAWYADVPKIELFCRGKPRPGWSGWGNEVEAA